MFLCWYGSLVCTEGEVLLEPLGECGHQCVTDKRRGGAITVNTQDEGRYGSNSLERHIGHFWLQLYPPFPDHQFIKTPKGDVSLNSPKTLIHLCDLIT